MNLMKRHADTLKAAFDRGEDPFTVELKESTYQAKSGTDPAFQLPCP